MKFQFVLIGALCLAGLLGSTSYAGITINGTTITFNDNSMQSTAATGGGGSAPADHGGTANSVSGTDSFIGGGYSNLVTDDASTIAGGFDNQAGNNAMPIDDAKWATVGGGDGNTASGVESTVSGGGDNTASGPLSTIAGGGGNYASGNYSTVSGGIENRAGGYYSTVAGGRGNVANGTGSFAAGSYANDGGYYGVFVWGDTFGGTATVSNSFNVFASGGIFFNGSVQRASDRNMKEAFSFVSAREVLDKVVKMPVTTWRFKSEDDSVRHIGPVAQDFMAAFGYGKDDRYITATDAEGVAFAAIQGLNAKVEEQAETITAMRWHNAQLQAILRSRDELLEARFARLEKAILKEED